LRGQCLPRQLALNDEGQVPCAVVEVLHPRDGALTCGAGRGTVSDLVAGAVRDELEESEYCTAGECESLTMCEIEQLAQGEERDACLTRPLGAESSLEPGYCYVDPEQGFGSPALVAGCRSSERRMLRFVGAETPASNTTEVVACTGEQIQTKDIPAPAP
jgi:hypothetical protein